MCRYADVQMGKSEWMGGWADVWMRKIEDGTGE
jgi:hypothetical protein